MTAGAIRTVVRGSAATTAATLRPVPARYRCAACGNLTRFDVTLTRRTRRFHHYTVGGELSVEDEQVLSEVVEDVSCRWCGSAKAVEALADGEEA